MKHLSSFLFLLLLLSSCQRAPAAPLATAPPAPLATPDEAHSRQAVIDALLAMTQKPNRMVMTTTKEDGTKVVTTIETVPPDRKHLASEGVEYIAAEGKVYMKTGEAGAWKAAPIAAESFIPSPAPTAESIGKTISNARAARSETVDGKETWVYTYTSTIKQGEYTLVSQAEVWVGTASGLPVKYVTDGDTLGMQVGADGKSKPVIYQTTSTLRVFFDDALKIEPPAP